MIKEVAISTVNDPRLTVDQALDVVVESFGGTRRDGQHQMSNAIEDSMTSGTHLLVQAGTGTGKSLGYIIPSILRAAYADRRSGNHRTVIATATIALQRQLVSSDLPKAMEALRDTLGVDVRFAVLKGRNNYVCLDKFNRDGSADVEEENLSLFEGNTSYLARQAKKLRQWVSSTATGDKDDFGDDIDPRLWRSMSVSGRECVGKNKCVWGEQCFAEAAREKAYESDIIVTNHTMLALDVIEQVPILPEHKIVVIDEAHELVDQTTKALSGELSAVMIERAAGLVRKFVPPATHELLLDAADELGKALENYDTNFAVTQIEEIVGTLKSVLTQVKDACKSVSAEVTMPSTDESDVAAAKQRAKVAISEIGTSAISLLGTDKDSVTWLDKTRTPTLHHAPLSVSSYLRDALFTQHTIVLTSATLQVGGSMDNTARAVGLIEEPKRLEFPDAEHVDDVAQRDFDINVAVSDQDDVPDSYSDDDPWGETNLSWVGLDVGSPFDYQQQAILYCATHLPAPMSDGISEQAFDELAELIDAAGGRSLCLFSSWRSVERAGEYLGVRFADQADRPLIIAKRGDATPALVEKFKANPRATLLGTRSFWQGIDVPGPTCTLVTIDRIPFPRPDEPVYSARSQRASEQGLNGFTAVSVPHAALLLAQGVGRLIRTTDDRGVVAILDSRLDQKPYGKTLRKTLPDMYYTTDKSSVIGALRRLDEQYSR